MNQLGYYGKTAHRGDFVRFNLPQSFITVWDDWLRDIMIQGESRHSDWAERYAQTPTYRFVLSGGIAGNTPWQGVMAASADKVGRRFPFCLVHSLPEESLPIVSLFNRLQWFQDAEELLNKTLSNDYVFDELQTELQELAERHSNAVPTRGDLPVQDDQSTDEQFNVCLTHSSTLPTERSLAPMLDTVLQRTVSEYSLWHCSGKDTRLVLSSGLPIDDAGLALITADWESAANVLIDLTAWTQENSAENLPPAMNDGEEQAVPQPGQADDETEARSENSPDATATRTQTVGEQPAREERSGIDEQNSDDADAQTPSADDWAALDEFSSDEPFEEVIVPTVEPLELEEDDLPDAPWER